ncbi:DUF1553 domain-containing protein [Symmachiella dynata]|uniref:DUF1553 domain-containing protein n=1 Tax=Symmachiella dynata TaxID=2527995 RepID=UPI0030EBC4E9
MRLPEQKLRFPSLIMCCGMALLLAPCHVAWGGQEIGNPSQLVMEPAQVQLNGTRATQQLQVSGILSENNVRDLTGAAEFTSSDEAIVKVVGGVALPVANGTAEITATAGGQTANIAVTVAGMETPTPVSFKNGTIAALSKAGCNMGACHGSPSGKAGFRLSLRGYDPALDIVTLRTEFFGRRTNAMAPEESLILTKPLMQVAHGGGRRLHKTDPGYKILRDWIGEGLRLDAESVPDVVKVEVFPSKRVFQPGSDRQQLRVDAHFSDGTVRDVTAIAVYSSSNESVATVGDAGLVSKHTRGESAVLVRYLDKMETSYITFLDDVEGFAWNNPPENNFVDSLVFAKLNQLQILPSELCSDEEFLRRAYLDTTGRLPTIEESQAFLSRSEENKRALLIDHLLDTDDFASYWTLKWGDILRSNSKKLNAKGVHKFRRWIYDAVRTDKPIDQFTRELLTAQGSVFENPPANYWRASRDPLDATETTAQLFLGIRIQCAKCHNHPFEKWTQDNYYGIGAVFARVGRKTGFEKDDEIIFVSNSGEVKQPRTGQTMKPHLLLKGDVDVPEGQDRREVFAEWLTAADNPFFAKVAVNRIWGHLMGRGIVEPVDDFRDSNPPSNAPLLDKLAEDFIANNYSRKWAIRTIMNSRTYQLSSRKNDFNDTDEIYNSHAGTRMLSAEQLLDAICQVTSVPENFKGLPVGFRAVELPDPPTDHYFLKIFGQPQREMACACERSNESNLSQALQMINGPVVHNKLRDDKGRIAAAIAAGKDNATIITELYLAALSRQPAEEELAAAIKHVGETKDKERRMTLEDVGWALLNSKEFLFQH